MRVMRQWALLLAALLAVAVAVEAAGGTTQAADKGAAAGAAGGAGGTKPDTATTGAGTAETEAAGKKPVGGTATADAQPEVKRATGGAAGAAGKATGTGGAAGSDADMEKPAKAAATAGKAAAAGKGAGAATATGATGAKAAPSEEEEEEAAAAAEDVAAAQAYDGPEIVANTIEEAEAAVEEGVAAQKKGKRKKVVSKLVAQAKAVELPGGDDDIPLTGACKNNIRQFCRKVKPGEGRLASCLLEQMQAASADDSEHERLSRACEKVVDAFMQAFTSNVNANLPIAKGCKKDIEQFCSKVKPEDEGGVLDCLRKRRKKLRGKCQSLIFELEQAASDDYRLDPKLLDACKSDIARLCHDKINDPHGGEVQFCMLDQEGSLEWRCKRELFREEMEQSDDIRLSLGLMRACYDSKEQFCEGVAPGESNVKDCLELHMYEGGFGEECLQRLVAMVDQRSKYFRLDSVLREHCLEDIMHLCGISDPSLVGGVDFLGAPLTMDEEGISKCLQDHRDELRNPVCAERVRRVIAATLRGVQFNHPLAEACAKDRERLCGGEPLGSPTVLRCLGRQREKLDPACAAKLFDTEVAMAENIDFNWPLKEACAREIKKHCGGVPHGHGRVIRCLEHAVEKEEDDFSEKCREAVEGHVERAGYDYRLNFRLASACKDDIKQLCPAACGNLQRKTECGGSVLQCLSNWLGNIESEECTAEVEYYQRMSVRDFKNDVALAEACRQDVDEYCKDERADGVLACLHKHRPRLSGPCREEETRMDVMQSRSVDLLPGVTEACAEERKAHCPKIRADKAAVLNCLLSAAADELDFSSACVDALDSVQERRVLDWRTDYEMRGSCKADAGRYCGEALKLAGPTSVTAGLDGAVFACLLDNHPSLESTCANDVSRVARTSLEFYQPGRMGVGMCDDDIARLCPHSTGAGHVSLAVIRDCLAEQLAAEREAEGGSGAGHSAVSAGSHGPQRRRLLAEEDASSSLLPFPPTEAAWRRKQQEQRGEAEAAEDASAEQTSGRGGEDTSADASAAGEDGEEAAVAGAAAAAPAEKLSQACRAFLEVALPADPYEHFQDSMTATGVLTQLASIESGLGLPHGTLHNPAATAGHDVLTLTGWMALAGVFALATVVLALVVVVVRRYTGMGGPNASARGYTMVIKHETEMAPTHTSPRTLPRRYG